MADPNLVLQVDTDPSVAGKTKSLLLRRTIADAFTAIRSSEVNKAIAGVTLEDLMQEQIERNGESERSAATAFDPYSYDPQMEVPSADTPATIPTTNPAAVFTGGTFGGLPTKLDRVLAIANSVIDVANEVMAMEVIEVASEGEYDDGIEFGLSPPEVTEV